MMSKQLPGEDARKTVLPSFELTELTSEGDPGATQVEVLGETYYTRSKLLPGEGKRRDGKSRWVRHQFNLLPVVLSAHHVPWPEANVYVISRLESTVHPHMSTFASIVEDLAAFRRFLDENDLDWTHFPVQKLSRPTYRFNGHLKVAISAGHIAASTAKRRMSTVVGFYRWLTQEGALTPDNPPWKEADYFVHFRGSHGFNQSKMLKVTDVHLKIPKQMDPYDGCIDDGAKLRPLIQKEQEWLVNALVSLRNIEMTLIHLFSLLTGARIQTALTLRLRHALLEVNSTTHGEVRLPVGPGTGVDTKNSKRLVLHIPQWFYQMLRTYALSERARQRRARAIGGDHPDQYLFLSQRSAPLYQAREDTLVFNRTNSVRHQKVGQGVRQFIHERVIPSIRLEYNEPRFKFQFHDLRATAGMNWTDQQLQLVSSGKATLHQAREYVRVRMGHESSQVTDRYLNYRHNLEMVRWIEEEHESHLKALSLRVMESFV